MDELEKLKARIEELRVKKNAYNTASYHRRKNLYVRFRRKINQIEHDYLVKCLEEYRKNNLEEEK